MGRATRAMAMVTKRAMVGKGGKRDGDSNEEGNGNGSKRDDNGNKEGEGEGGKRDGNSN
jgi:hypothetical protein